MTTFLKSLAIFIISFSCISCGSKVPEVTYCLVVKQKVGNDPVYARCINTATNAIDIRQIIELEKHICMSGDDIEALWNYCRLDD